MKKQDYIMLIINCKKYLKKAKYQKMTWLKEIPSYLTYYHVIGDETLDHPFRFDENERILWVNVPDDYVSLPKKVIKALEGVNETFDFQYIFKTDDDQIVVNNKFFDILKNKLSSKIPKTHYGGFIIDIKHDQLSTYNIIHPELPDTLPIYKTKMSNGRFYYLSKEVVLHLLTKKELIEKEYLEDYAIGYNIDEKFKTDIVNINTHMYFKDVDINFLNRLIKKGKL